MTLTQSAEEHHDLWCCIPFCLHDQSKCFWCPWISCIHTDATFWISSQEKN